MSSKLFEVLGMRNLIFSSLKITFHTFHKDETHVMAVLWRTKNEVSHPQDLKKLRKYDFYIRASRLNKKPNYGFESGSSL